MTMHCHQWDALFDDWRDGRLDPTAAEACRAHAAGCSRCADVLALFEDDALGADDLHGQVDLLSGVLARTSGSACGRARDLMGARPDGDLDDESVAMLAAHLEHCSECAALDGILAWAMPAVRELAEPEPDPAFTFDVLRATSAARHRRRSGAIYRVRERAVAWWETQISRPQFAWEAAFVATVLAVIVFGTPLSPARNTPRKALEAVEAGPGWMIGRAGSVVGAAGEAVVELKADIDRRRDLTAPNRADLRRHSGNLGEAVFDADADAARAELDRIRDDIDELWKTWRAAGENGAAPADTSNEESLPRPRG
jgi:hypothetical protein